MISSNKKEKKENFYDIFDEDDSSIKNIQFQYNHIFELVQSFSKKKTKRIRGDNIRSRIINHFINFMINFLNDYVFQLYGYQKVNFIKINYNDRKKIDTESLLYLMNLRIQDLCSMKISSKIKRYSTDHNLKCLNIVKDKLGNDFINQRVLDFYQNFYLIDYNKLLNFGIKESTKNFYSLLKEVNKDKKYKEKLVETGINLVTEFIQKKRKKKFKDYDPDYDPSNVEKEHSVKITMTDDEFMTYWTKNTDLHDLYSNVGNDEIYYDFKNQSIV